MKGPLLEDEVVAVFLRGEMDSPRFGGAIRDALQQRGWPKATISHPDLGDPAQNSRRRELLRQTRGYAAGTGLFDGFPGQVAWSRTLLSPGELASVRYTDYSYWVELSAGSRLPADAAVSVKAGRSVFGQSNEAFLAAASAVRRGQTLPEMVVVGTDPGRLVVLEGHLRLTAYALCDFPTSVVVIMGLSREMVAWSLYGDP